jgi:Zn-dependent protease
LAISVFSSTTELTIRKCKTCGRELATTELACVQCHTLAFSEELTILSARANRLEEQGDFAQALEEWRKSLDMLPHQSTQADWVRDHVRKLELSVEASPPPPKNNWAKKLGPFAPIAIFLAKAKWLFALFKFKFLFSLGAFFALYWAMWGWKFGVGFAVLILIHEMGHYIDIRRRGLPADMPVFLPGFGAYVRWQALGVSEETRAAVSLAGPLAGLLASVACLLLWWQTGNPLWAGLARAGAWLNLMNLIPIWVLDGGQATNALDRNGRWVLLASTVFLALIFQEGVFVLVAAGFVWRLLTKDLPAVSSPRTVAYFASVIAFLGVVLRFVPGHGFTR